MNENEPVPTRQLDEPRWLMPLVDMLLALLAFGLAYIARYQLQLIREVGEFNRSLFWPYLPYALVFTVWLYLMYRGGGLYKTIRGRSWLEEVYTIINGVTNATVVIMALSFILQPLVFSRLMIIYAAAITVILLALSRAVRRMILARLREQGIGVQRVLVIGAGDVGRAVLRTLIARRELGYFPVGYLDDDPERGNANLGRMKGLGGIDNLRRTLREQCVDTVMITLPWSHHERIMELSRICQQSNVQVSVVPEVFQLNMRQVQVENLDGIPLLRVSGEPHFPEANRVLKRVLDLALVILASPALLLVFLIVVIAIRLEGPGPILYSQRRIGENGHPFDIVKFRSMIPDADRLRDQLIKASGEDPRHPKIKNDPRVTRVGRIIRATSLDELPQLYNVLRGQMSLVGPRPPTPDEVALYLPWHKQRLQIMPGMTGLWQVSGRSDVPFEEMCLLDIYYIENWSVRLDAQILMMTIPRVLFGHGAY